jgi:hypothetical protein
VIQSQLGIHVSLRRSDSDGGFTYTAIFLTPIIQCSFGDAIFPSDVVRLFDSIITFIYPKGFIEALQTCINARMLVVILDSISAEWQTILQEHSVLTGNSYTNWSKFTPRHQLFVNAIIQSDVHIICTLRSKQAYVLTEKNGKQVPEKVGMKPVQRDDVDYELSLVFQLSMKHLAVAVKDRTEIFADKPEFLITVEFSSSRSFNRLTSDASMPPYRLSQL